jgi:uncharacterized protein (TIGR00661 family)
VKKQAQSPVRILFAPLDWGLGHATRCIPLIQYFLQNGCEVWIAAEGKTRQLLSQEFPQVTFIALKGYRIQYANSKIGLVFKLLGQIPRILQTIRYEHRWLQEAIALHDFDAVVSDNRFGLHHPIVPCIYITHQLKIQVPGGPFAENMLQALHYRFINRFRECWVPDFEKSPTLAGQLAHPARFPSVPVHYLGPLSRLHPQKTPLVRPLLILLSGPEPQRTLFERLLLHELRTFDGNALFVRGLPGDIHPIPGFNHVTIHNHLRADLLNEAICSSEWIIGRTGYTTVMDLVSLGKKSILIPTPGQTEQEYLSEYLRQEGLSYTLPQASFSLKKALEGASTFPYRFFPPDSTEGYKKIAAAFLQSLRQQ